MNENKMNKSALPKEMTDEDINRLLDEWLKDEPLPVEEPPAEEKPMEEPVVQRPQRRREKKTGWQGTVLMYLHDLAFLLAGLILVFLLLFRVVVVSGTSMNRTLLDGDYLLLLSSTFYKNPKPGDVIVASKQSFDNGAPIVKRVIATEGQWVDIDFASGVVYVGDSKESLQPLDEPYTLTPTNTDEGIDFPLQVSEGCIFVLGDNRNASKDSRHPEIGLVDKREVLGKVFFLFLPGTNGTDIHGQPIEQKDFGRIGVIG